MPVVITFDEAKPDPAILLKVWRQCTSRTNPETVTLSDAGLPTTIGGYGVTVSYGEDTAAPAHVPLAAVRTYSPPASVDQVKSLFVLWRAVSDGSVSGETRHAFTQRILGRRPSWSIYAKEMTVADYEALKAALEAKGDGDKPITHEKAQALHARWREVAIDTSEVARHRFTRAVLGTRPRWNAGGMTNAEADQLFAALNDG